MLKDMKIASRLIAAFVVVALFASISGIVSIFMIINVNKEYPHALVNYGFAQGDIGKAMLMIADNRRAVRDVVNYDNPKNIETAINKITENPENYYIYAASIEESIVIPKAKVIFDDI